MAIDSIKISQNLVIPNDELLWRFSTSSGPGGQHVNTANTRVELTWNITQSRVLSNYQRALLLENLGSIARVVVSDGRSQMRNREIAVERLAERVKLALQVRASRRPSRPRKSAVEKRLENKRVQGERKRSRRETGFETE